MGQREEVDPVVRQLIEIAQASGLAVCVYCLQGIDLSTASYLSHATVGTWWYDTDGAMHYHPTDILPRLLVACASCIATLQLSYCLECSAIFPSQLARQIWRYKLPKFPLISPADTIQLCPECVSRRLKRKWAEWKLRCFSPDSHLEAEPERSEKTD